ncbi:MAG: hypothetical protein PWP37_527 [Thermotogota bacterium]|nr:hypothetical protein [Thermotogota bacterium]
MFQCEVFAVVLRFPPRKYSQTIASRKIQHPVSAFCSPHPCGLAVVCTSACFGATQDCENSTLEQKKRGGRKTGLAFRRILRLQKVRINNTSRFLSYAQRSPSLTLANNYFQKERRMFQHRAFTVALRLFPRKHSQTIAIRKKLVDKTHVIPRLSLAFLFARIDKAPHAKKERNVPA